jgi:hypothetical protein
MTAEAGIAEPGSEPIDDLTRAVVVSVVSALVEVSGHDQGDTGVLGAEPATFVALPIDGSHIWASQWPARLPSSSQRSLAQGITVPYTIAGPAGVDPNGQRAPAMRGRIVQLCDRPA